MSKQGDLWDEVNASYFQKDSTPVTRVYVDLEYLQDLRFGAMIHGFSVKEEMSYIQSCIGIYNSRYDQKCANYFPVLRLTDDELDRRLKEPITKDKICFVAPWTSVYFNLVQILDAYNNHNKRMLSQESKIKLTINVADVEYPVELQAQFCKSLEQQIGIEVEFQTMPRYIADVSEYLSYDLLFLYDYGRFVNTFGTKFVGEGAFFEKKIVAYPYIQEGLGHKPEEYEDIIASTEKGLDIYCDFKFLRSYITLDTKE